MKLGDHLGLRFDDEDFADLFLERGQPGLRPHEHALVTLLQFREILSDRQAVEAVCARTDLKYLLGLKLDESGLDFSVLYEFLVAGGAGGSHAGPFVDALS